MVKRFFKSLHFRHCYSLSQFEIKTMSATWQSLLMSSFWSLCFKKAEVIYSSVGQTLKASVREAARTFIARFYILLRNRFKRFINYYQTDTCYNKYFWILYIQYVTNHSEELGFTIFNLFYFIMYNYTEPNGRTLRILYMYMLFL